MLSSPDACGTLPLSNMSYLRENPEMLRRFRAGEPSALDWVYRTYLKFVDIVICRGVTLVSRNIQIQGAREHADRLDLIQTTFTQAFSQAARQAYDGLRDYRPYLLTICRNVLIDWTRKRGRELPSAEIDQIPVEDPGEEQAAWADPAVMKIVNEYLAGLPAALAAVHQHRYVLGVSQLESAQNLGLTRQRLRTLEQKLKKGLLKALKKARISI